MGKLVLRTVARRSRQCSDHGRIGPALELTVQIVQASFSQFELDFEGGLARKLPFSHLPVPDFEGSLARKLRFHICHFQFLREASHKSFIFISATFRF